jgi:hypothetical protein
MKETPMNIFETPRARAIRMGSGRLAHFCMLTTLFIGLALSNAVSQAGDWVNLIQGEDLSGWKKLGGGATYVLKDGVITGTTGEGKNTFLTAGPYSDFILEFEVRCDAALNSGVQIRSHIYEKETPQESRPQRMRAKGEVYGYQCEITSTANDANGCAGNFWDEGRRTRWMDESVDGPEKQKLYKPNEWNKYVVVAQGERIRSFVNGEPVADFTDDRDASGFIGLQVHSIKKGTGPYTVSWRNIRIRELGEGESADDLLKQ